MTRPVPVLPTLAALSLLLLAVPSAGPAADAPGHRRIGDDLEPLRSRFNQQVDDARAVLLVAPT